MEGRECWRNNCPSSTHECVLGSVECIHDCCGLRTCLSALLGGADPCAVCDLPSCAGQNICAALGSGIREAIQRLCGTL